MLTSNQHNYLRSLIEKLGFKDHNKIEQYVDAIVNEYRTWDWEIYDWSYSDCFEILKEELDIKKNKKFELQVLSTTHYTATDFAQYTFCPVSFSISKTIKIPDRESTEIGLDYHNKNLLVKKYDRLLSDQVLDDIYGVFQHPIIRAIRKSEVIFSGHTDNSTKTFNNENQEFTGIPDYIFKDRANKFFIVEEKFHRGNDPIKIFDQEKQRIDSENFRLSHSDDYTKQEIESEYIKSEKYLNDFYQKCLLKLEHFSSPFYENHIIQVVSYLHNIQEYILDRGYLVYWFYDYKANGETYLFKVLIKEIRLNDNTIRFYNDIKHKLHQLKTAPSIIFDPEKLSANKCVKCIMGKYCGHKNGRLSTLTFPYSVNDIRVFLNGYPYHEPEL